MYSAVGAIARGGFLSIGIAHTLQVLAERCAKASRAAVIYSSEGVFAAIGGWWILGEVIGWHGWAGAALILTGMLVAQLGRRP
ncbi:MAG: EamA family transporter [Tepidimonas sp.]|uniref:EamA family transporter n=1 Tax=Tepidimonas sp. TaxID=2002775 RepID=UPI004054C0AA